jgi:hypothetical protein
VHAVTQLLLYLSKLRSHAVAPSFALELESSAPGPTANEREPQEGKGLWLAKPLPLSPSRRLTAELQQSGLLPVKLEPELLEPRSHRIPEAPCIGFVLEAGHQIIGIAHEDHVAGGFSPSPLHSPEVEDVVKEDVGKQWRGHATYAKGDFEFERRISLCRTLSVLDLRRKK